MYRKDLRGPDLMTPISRAGVTPEEAEQLEAARRIALDLIVAGGFGSTSPDDFRVTIEGHANFQHKPQFGLPAEFVTMTVAHSPLSS